MESASIFCARCERHVNFEFDRSVLETICTECGLLLESHESIEISDGRTFGNGLGNNELHRVGDPCSPYDEGLSTAISKNPDGEKGEFGRFGNQGSITECSLIEAFETVATVADRLKSTNNKRGIPIPTQLPNDIINEIILRLPAISNFRFKCVSKQWFSLNFEALKLKSQTHTAFGIFYGTYDYEDVRDGRAKYVKTEEDQNNDPCIDGTLSFLPERCYMRIRDSCNGLLLCECKDKPILPTGALEQKNSRLYVCNPAMRKWIEIPNIFMGKIQLAILDFKPLVSVHFKVIIILSDFQVLSRNFKIFSSKTGEWSASCVRDRLLFQPRLVPVVFCEGQIFGMDHFGKEITGIDLEGKLCSRTEFPGKPYLNNHPPDSHLCQFGGCLHYYCYGNNNEVHVWKLESGSWLLKSCFSVPFPRRYIEGIKFHPVKDDVVFLQINDRLYSYNIKTTQAIKLCSYTLAHNYCLYSPFYLDFSGSWWKKMNG